MRAVGQLQGGVGVRERFITRFDTLTASNDEQPLAGTKVGTREDRYGLFGKIRVGLDSHSAAAESSGFRRYNATAVDTGGVLERYFGRRWVIRFDAGEVLSAFHPSEINLDGSVIRESAPPRTASIQLAIGPGGASDELARLLNR